MSFNFFTKDLSNITEGSHWKYVESGSTFRDNGTPDYVILERAARDLETNRYPIHDILGEYTHRFKAPQILEWFIPFDKKYRDDAVRLGVILTRLREHGVPSEEIHELLIALEI